LLLALSLATGCHKLRPVSMPPAPTVLPPAPSPVPPPDPDAIRAAQIKAQVRQATALLAQLPNSPQNAVPDAVLNGAQCLIVATDPSAGRWRQVSALISCRAGDRWSPPEFLMLSLAGPRRPAGVRLLWIANRPGSQAIRQNTLRRALFQPGPLERQSPTPAETQLTADILSYEYIAGRLSGSQATIATAQPSAVTNGFYNHRAKLQPVAGTSDNRAVDTQPFIFAATSFFNTITPVGILIHHSGLIPIKVAAQLKEQVAEMIDEFHARRGFEIICFGRVYHVGYHYLILPNGKVEAGRPERCEGAHARGYNSFIGIALVGDFSPATNPADLYGPSAPTRVQMRSLIKLCRRLRWRYQIPIQRVMRHSDVTATYCPGSRFPIRALLRALEKGGPS
jgi:N-acetylmuramoyl-L-alanine amidase